MEEGGVQQDDSNLFASAGQRLFAGQDYQSLGLHHRGENPRSLLARGGGIDFSLFGNQAAADEVDQPGFFGDVFPQNRLQGGSE